MTISKITNNAPGYTLNKLTVPFSLGPGQGVNFDVTFTPFQNQQSNGNFAFFSNGANSPYYVYVYGKGAPGGVVSPNPASIDFGSVQVGKNQSQYETLTNTGTATTTISQANVTGTGFSIQGLNLPLILDAGKSWTFSAWFSPQATGPANGSIIVISDAFNPTATIPLSGVGTAAGTLTAAPATLDFGVVAVGDSKSLPATLIASGATVTVSSVQTDSGEFTVSGLSLPLAIPSGQNQPYTVTYTPQNTGTGSGTATFTSDASNSPTLQGLTGMGSAPIHHSVDLSWNASKSQVAGYNVYRGDATGGPYSKINSSLQVSTAYEDGSVSSGSTYYYVATAVDDKGAESVYSNEARANIPKP